MKFEYSEIKKTSKYMEISYLFDDIKSRSLIKLLNEIGLIGWELIGLVEGKLIVKRKI